MKLKIDQVQSGLPGMAGCVLWLMLDRLAAGPLVCGIAWTIYGFVAIAYALDLFTTKTVTVDELWNRRKA